MGKKIIGLFLVCLFVFASLAHAKDNKYIYRKRAEWVKLNKLSNRQLAGVTLNHPTLIPVDKMTEMLLSIEMNKAKLLKKGLTEAAVFSGEEAGKFAPLIVKALNAASPNQVVNVSVLHKRPYFVIRDDHISVINVYHKEGKLHFYFAKLFAKITGDYEQASRIDESIRKAKSIRVDLQAGPGQVLDKEGREIVLSLDQAYAKDVSITQESPQKAVATTATGTEANVTPQEEDIAARLEKLKNLKDAHLISAAEYARKKKEILQGL